MSERERWIVYPLLFFALGAAVHDKMLHRVDTKEIYCESLKIVDQQNPNGRTYVELSIERNNPTDPAQRVEQRGQVRILDNQGQRVCQMDSRSLLLVSQPEKGKQAFAELAVNKTNPNNPASLAEEVGMLRLVDSEGRLVCALHENARLQRVISNQLDIVDPDHQRRVMITTEKSPELANLNGEQTFTSQGVIQLNNPQVRMKIAPPPVRLPRAKLPASEQL